MSSEVKESKLDAASFVVVANRLPVERVELPDGTTDWRSSPGGLVTAFEPIMHKRRGRLGRLAWSSRRGTGTVRGRWARAGPSPTIGL